MNVPKIRFPQFVGDWQTHLIDSILERSGDAVKVELDKSYRQIGVRSHGRGLFHKEAVTGKELGGKRVFHVVPNAFVINIVFAWEQAISLTTDSEQGFIASHRFPMFLEKDDKSFLPFIRELFLRKRGKQLLELASPGGAGRNKTLGQQAFLKLKIQIPSLPEQKKIADFLGVVDAKIAALRARQAGLARYKRGLMQALFSQRLRFTKPDGTPFPDWEEKRLGELGSFSGGGTPDTDVDRYWGGQTPWISSSDVLDGNLTGATITRWITEEAIKSSATKRVSKGTILIVTRVGVGKLTVAQCDLCTSQDFTNFLPLSGEVNFIAYWLLENKNTLLRLCQGTSIKGLTVEDLKTMKIKLPHPDEQQKIADALSALDTKIQAVAGQVAQMEQFKKGLLQQMFV